MAGYREKFLRSVHFLGGTLSPKLLVNITNKRLIVPIYHAVSDAPIKHIKHLYKVKNVKEFTNDLDFLLKNFTPIDYDQLKTIIEEGTIPKKNSFILTFDDGLKEFYEVISPILLKKGIPAICFLNSDFIDNKSLFFRYKASLLLESFSVDKNLQTKIEVKNWIIKNSFGKKNELKQLILSANYNNQQILDSLAKSIDLDFNEYLQNHEPYLNSIQIDELIKMGFFFGSHSCDHPEYQYLNLADQISQTEKSMAEISGKFGLKYNTFAFPFTDYGVSKKYFDQILKVKKSIDLSFGSAGLKNELYSNHIQRIPFEVGNLNAKEILNSEYLYYIIKFIFGKNTIFRK